MAKKTGKHGLIWAKVERIQTAPDNRRADIERAERIQWELKNAYRL